MTFLVLYNGRTELLNMTAAMIAPITAITASHRSNRRHRMNLSAFALTPCQTSAAFSRSPLPALTLDHALPKALTFASHLASVLDLVLAVSLTVARHTRLPVRDLPKGERYR